MERAVNLFWRVMYGIGFTPWEGAEAPPLRKLIESHRPPGRALDLGCGAGARTALTWRSTGGRSSASTAYPRAAHRTPQSGSAARSHR